MTILDWLIVAAYLLFALGTGIYLTRRSSRSTSDFFLAGRSLPWWMLGTSMVATTFAADTPLAITEMVRGHGIWRNWWWWNLALGGLLGVFLFSRLWRRAGVLTDNELIELRYSGRPAAFLRGFKAGWFATVYNFIVMGWVINGMSTVVQVLTGSSPQLTTWTLVTIAVVYTVLSGFWGVVVTDLVQFILAMTGSILLAWFAVAEVGGLSALQQKLAGLSDTPQHLTSFVPTFDGFGDGFMGSSFFTFFIFITLMWWSNHNADGGGYVIQRMMACRSERDAVKASLWYNVANYALRVWPWILVALVSLVLFPHIADTTEASGNKLAYPMVLKAVLGPGLRGLLVTTFLAAFMSTIDTHLNWGASYVVNDIYRRFLKPQADERHYVFISRLTILVLITLSAALSFFMSSIDRAWIFVWAMGAGIGLVLILRWFWWRINAWSELSALGASILVTFGLEILAFVQSAPGEYRLFATAPELFGQPVSTAVKALIVVPFSIVVWVSVTLLTKPEPRDTLERFYERVRPGGAWGELKERYPHAVGQPSLLRAFLPSWIGGALLIYGVTFFLGHLLLLHAWPAALCALCAVAGAVLIWFFQLKPNPAGEGSASPTPAPRLVPDREDR